MILSILTPSIITRSHYLEQLRSSLQHQVDARKGEVEWLISVDDQELSTGEKRNVLVAKANGTYVVHVDDDDSISHRYVDRMLEGCRSNKDAITYLMDMYESEFYTCTAKFGLHKEEQIGTIKHQPILHTCPVLKQIAQRVKFPDQNRKEDIEWSKQVQPLIKTVHHIDEVLYTYWFRKARPQDEVSISHKEQRKVLKEMGLI